jgi:integrase
MSRSEYCDCLLQFKTFIVSWEKVFQIRRGEIMAKLQEYRPQRYRFRLRGKPFYVPPGIARKRDAEHAKSMVEALAASAIAGSVPPERVATWLDSIGPELTEKLVNFGLLTQKAVRHSMVAVEFFEACIAERTDVSTSTRKQMRSAVKYWRQHHQPGVRLDDYTRHDALSFSRKLVAGGIAESTAQQMIYKSKGFFAAAIDAELIARNPFERVTIKQKHAADKYNPEFISRETIDRVLRKCPDTEWRLLVALARYAGLRMPSESDVLTWDDVDFEAGEIIVRSPKTGTRIVPLFPELIAPLREAFELASVGTVNVITRHRGKARRTFGRIVERAGVVVWPRVFHSLRATRETELAEQFPIHVVCKWLGNSAPVAQRHYLSVTPAQMERARTTCAPEKLRATGNLAKSPEATSDLDT